MKAIKTLMAASVLAAAGAANATVWDITVVTDTYFAAADTVGSPHNNFTMNYTGTYDDVSNSGVITGVTNIVDYAVVLNITNESFTMNEATGVGSLIKVAAPATCTDNNANPGASCVPFTALLKGPMYNNINGTNNGSLGGFVPADGLSLTWTTVISAYNADLGIVEQNLLPLTVTLHSQVPVPAAAWLFGSGLLGLAGTARRRRVA